MFEHLNTPQEIFSFKLGSAHSMETKLVEVLEELEGVAQRDEIKQALRQHREETRQHAMNIEQCFSLLGEEIDDSPCPVAALLQQNLDQDTHALGVARSTMSTIADHGIAVPSA